MMGVSRSATVVCAYLIATKAMTAPEAIAFVTERRSIVSPNVGFQRQLETYAMRFGSKGAKAKGSLMSRVKRLQGQSAGEASSTSAKDEEEVLKT
jgi:atypical dual specificity phosphatase